MVWYIVSTKTDKISITERTVDDMVKMNFSNDQTAFAYAIYMIASSYFDKAICRNKFFEGTMVLQYKEQKNDTQYRMEDGCILLMDKLYKELPEDVFSHCVDVHFKRKSEKDLLMISLDSEAYSFRISGSFAKKKAEFSVTVVDLNADAGNRVILDEDYSIMIKEKKENREY